ncbi:MAG: dTDP-glucose 4,6-dehydratase [Candidatus Coatesbacteria bacterium]|nr:dTDP-glucose 4,6-dehydratase [Candidatus Coatesbacteria bacterium]
MRLLVTGGAGFIGSNFIRHILTAHPEWYVCNLDKLTYAGNLENTTEFADNPNYRFLKGDVADREIVEPLVKWANIIVHFAAETHNDRSVMDAGEFITTDVFGTFVMLECAKQHGVDKFIHISTDEVYGDSLTEASTERSPLMPKSPYAASKAGADRLAFSYWATHKVPVIITRCSNNYGPCQLPEKMIPLFATNAIEDKPLPVYGEGTNKRDWIHVLDHCRAIELLILEAERFGEVYNVSSGHEVTILEMCDRILGTLGKPKELIQFVVDRPGHVLRHFVASEKIRREFNWSPKIEFEDGIKQTVLWYKDNPDWWHKIKERLANYYNKQYVERT